MKNVFGVTSYWYRYEFAPSRGQIHYHGLCWRHGRQPSQMLYEAVRDELSEDEIISELDLWAKEVFRMSASHPAGDDKSKWCHPEGSAPPVPEEQNPLLKLFNDISYSQEALLNDHILLSNKINMHVKRFLLEKR